MRTLHATYNLKQLQTTTSPSWKTGRAILWRYILSHAKNRFQINWRTAVCLLAKTSVEVNLYNRKHTHTHKKESYFNWYYTHCVDTKEIQKMRNGDDAIVEVYYVVVEKSSDYPAVIGNSFDAVFSSGQRIR